MLLLVISVVIAVLSLAPLFCLLLLANKISGLGWRLKESLLIAPLFVLLLPVGGYLAINLCTLVLQRESFVVPLLAADVLVSLFLGWRWCTFILKGESRRAMLVSALVTGTFVGISVLAATFNGPLWQS